MTRALVVDDSQFMRTVISDALEDHGYDVVTANSGEAALKAVFEHDPGVITMDVNMPGMGGIEAVEYIMRHRPTPILMLSAHTEDGADATLEALDRGAVDFLTKPDGEVTVNTVSLQESLQSTIDAVAEADVASLSSTTASAPTAEPPTSSGKRSNGEVATAARVDAADVASPKRPHASVGDSTETAADLAERAGAAEPTVIIGASTGGPNVVESIMRTLPPELDARVLIVQHMPSSFTGRFAKRLDELSAYDVREVAGEDRIGGGEALVARGGQHMEVTSDARSTLGVRSIPPEDEKRICPSIDVTMESAADVVSSPLVGVVLTGMGRDGAEGMRAIKHASGATLAQDEETSPVFGIPKQSIRTGCVDDVLPADRIVDGILDALRTEVDDNG